MNNRLNAFFKSILLSLALVFAGLTADAQTATFTYQGRLTDNAVSANGTYQMQFSLFDQTTGGNQIGATISSPTVQVTNGVFIVNLDFPQAAFTGANRFLQISVFSTQTNQFIELAPRQAITSAPYSIRAASAAVADNAANLGGVPADDFVQTDDARLADSRPPTADSPSYIQNKTSPQTSAGFNIDGTGTANVFNAAQQFNIGGSRVLGVTSSNTYLGSMTGAANTTGFSNSFFGDDAGKANTTGSFNSFFGASAGAATVTGSSNSFFGASAGLSNTGSENSFFGSNAGRFNTSGFGNSFFGRSAGVNNTDGSANSFFGHNAGRANVSGANNSFFGLQAGDGNVSGGSNSFFGRSAGFSNADGDNNSFFGRSAGEINTSGSDNAFFGTSAGNSNTQGLQNTFIGFVAGGDNTTGDNNTFIGAIAGGNSATGSNNTALGSNAGIASANLSFAAAIGAGASVSTSNTVVLGRPADAVRVPGNLVVLTLGSAGSTSLCRNASNQISTCTAGNFAEKTTPENAARFDALAEENAQMRRQIKEQKILLNGLMKIVCAQNPQADVCR